MQKIVDNTKLDLEYIMDFEEFFENRYQDLVYQLKYRIFLYMCRTVDGKQNKFFTINELCEEFKRSDSQISTNITDLENDGLVVKKQVKNPKRSEFHKKVFLTNKGISFKKYILHKITGKHDKDNLNK